MFGKQANDVEIVVHPQAVLHSAVLFDDGAVLGQFGVADMKLPIQLALTWPKRVKSIVEPFSFLKFKKLTFFEPDYETFGCLQICKNAFELGGFAPAIVHAANEQAVELFLQGNLKFLQIEELIKMAVVQMKVINENYSVKSILTLIEEVKSFVLEKAKLLN